MKSSKIWNYVTPVLSLLCLIGMIFLIDPLRGITRDLIFLVLMIGITVLILRLIEKASRVAR